MMKRRKGVNVSLAHLSQENLQADLVLESKVKFLGFGKTQGGNFCRGLIKPSISVCNNKPSESFTSWKDWASLSRQSAEKFRYSFVTSIFFHRHKTCTNTPSSYQPLLSLLMALFISIYYELKSNLSQICSSVNFHHPWHAADFDIAKQRLLMRFRRSFHTAPMRCTSVAPAPLTDSSPFTCGIVFAPSSASCSLMIENTSCPNWAHFKFKGLPPSLPPSHTQVWMSRFAKR